jgi:hypothetical protein
MLKTLFRYDGNPSLTEVAAYLQVSGLLITNDLRFQQRVQLPINQQIQVPAN